MNIDWDKLQEQEDGRLRHAQGLDEENEDKLTQFEKGEFKADMEED